jgi:hypothetical protein
MTLKKVGGVAILGLVVLVAAGWAQVSVQFELLMGPDGQPAGYKFSESLATLKPGDTIGLAVGMSFESITVKSIERTGDRLVIEPEKELTVEGRTKKRLEFRLVEGYWIEAGVLEKIQPAATAPAEAAPGSLPPWVLWVGGGALLGIVVGLVVWLARR